MFVAVSVSDKSSSAPLSLPHVPRTSVNADVGAEAWIKTCLAVGWSWHSTLLFFCLLGC